MKKIYTHENPIQVKLILSLIESHGIDCFLKNEYLPGAIGELPPIEAWSEVWISEDLNFQEAKAVVEEYQKSLKNRTKDWHCKDCKESNPAEFEICWNCGLVLEDYELII